MPDYSGASAALITSVGKLVADLATQPRRRLRVDWPRSEQEETIRQMQHRSWLAGQKIDDDQAKAVLAQIDRFLMDAAMALLRR